MWGELRNRSEPTPAVNDILPLSCPGSLHSMAYLAFHSESSTVALCGSSRHTLCCPLNTPTISHFIATHICQKLIGREQLSDNWLKLATRTWFLFSLSLSFWLIQFRCQQCVATHTPDVKNKPAHCSSFTCCLGLFCRSTGVKVRKVKPVWHSDENPLTSGAHGLEFPLPWRSFARLSLQPPSSAVVCGCTWNGGDLRN